MNFNIPMSDVGIIAGFLGAFFLLIAFYKSIFHSRKPPEEIALEAMEAQQKREKEESLRVSLSDPFTMPPPASPVSEVETQKQEPEPAPAPFFSAFRQLTPTGEVGEITVKNSDLYQWE